MTSRISTRLAALAICAAASVAVFVPASPASASLPVDKYCQTYQDAYDFWTYEAAHTTDPWYWDYATDRAIRAELQLNRYCNF